MPKNDFCSELYTDGTLFEKIKRKMFANKKTQKKRKIFSFCTIKHFDNL